MAFFKKGSKPAKESKKPRKGEAAPQEEEIRGEAPEVEKAPDPASDKQRIKKIRNMKKKFDETVWANAVDTMQKEIPQFTIMEPDPEDPGTEIARYVTLGFDTRIVDDFANKSDEDTGSFMTAVKSSMDCIVEYGLFDNELILMIPTSRTLAALDEFQDVFNLKFKIVYVTADHAMSIETKTPELEDDFVFITLPEIRKMLADNIYIKDQIKLLQGRAGDSVSLGGINGDGTRDSDSVPDSDANNGGDGDDAIPEDEYESEHGPMDQEDGPPDEPEEEAEPAGHGTGDVASAVEDAVKKAAPTGNKIADQKEDMDIPEGGTGGVPEGATAQQPAAAEQPAARPGAPGARPAAAAQRANAAINRIRSAAQKASDEARQDPQVQQGQQAMAPQTAGRFDDIAMDQYMARKYYSDDLGLEISSQPFDSMFVQTNPYTPFEEIDGDGWLDGYVNNLRRDANTRLAKLHQENLLLMRKRFILIVTKHCEAITKAVAIDDPSSRFGYAYAALTKVKEDSLNKMPDEAEAYKRECEEAYQARMRAEMENASSVAKANFINRYARDHERELREIEMDLRNNIESEFVAAVDNLRTERRNEAKRQLDLGISEALKICGDEYVKMIAMERKEYIRLQAVITNFMNENLAADDARIRTLAEEQRRVNETVQVRKEYDAALSLATKDFEARLSAAQAEIAKRDQEHEDYIDNLRDQHEHMMQELRNSHVEALSHKDHEIGLLNDQLSNASAQLEELTRKYANLDHETGLKYRAQIDMLSSERDAWNERADHLEKLHKYTDKLKLTGVVVAVAAALGIGVIIGCVVMSNARGDSAQGASRVQQDPIIHYFIDGEEVTGEEAAGSGAGIGADGGSAGAENKDE